MEFVGAAKDAAILGLPVNLFLPIWEKETAQKELKEKNSPHDQLKEDKPDSGNNLTTKSQAEALPGACSKSELMSAMADIKQEVSSLRTDMFNRTGDLLDVFQSVYNQQKQVLASMNKDIHSFMRDIMEKHENLARKVDQSNSEFQHKYETLLEELLNIMKCTQGHNTSTVCGGSDSTAIMKCTQGHDTSKVSGGPDSTATISGLVACKECGSVSSGVTTAVGVNDSLVRSTGSAAPDLSSGLDITLRLLPSSRRPIPQAHKDKSDKSSSSVCALSVTSNQTVHDNSTASLNGEVGKTTVHYDSITLKSLLDVHVHLVGSHCDCRPAHTKPCVSDKTALVPEDERHEPSVPCSEDASQDSTSHPRSTEVEPKADQVVPGEVDTDATDGSQDSTSDPCSTEVNPKADFIILGESETDTTDGSKKIVDGNCSEESSEANAEIVRTGIPKARNGRCFNMLLYGVNFSIPSDKELHDSGTYFFTSYYDVLRKSCKVRVRTHFDASQKLCVSVEITLVHASLVERWPLYIQADGYMVLGPRGNPVYTKVYDIKSQCPKLEEGQVKIIAAAVCLRTPRRAYKDVTYQQLVRLNYDITGFFNFKWRVLAF